MNESVFRRLPAVHEILRDPALAEIEAGFGRDVVLGAVRAALDDLRAELSAGGDPSLEVAGVARLAAARLAAAPPSLRRVINATGILLNTGLGRAPLAEEAVRAVSEVSRGYSNLEFDLEKGERGRRTDGVEALLLRLTGAEAATVVNNNAAATVLALRALAIGREVVISRAHLVEIGGSFRLPDIFEASGAKLREVGTTNRTRIGDYAKAIGPETAAVLRVHASNFRIVGFTEEASLDDLVALGRARGALVIDDVGSGALAPGRPPGIRDEPDIKTSLDKGSDLVLCSGDKLLGGPQCGLLLGRKETVGRLRSDPLMRAFRVDKMTLAALEATLALALDRSRSDSAIPLWRLLSRPLSEVQSMAEDLSNRLASLSGIDAVAEESLAYTGGGSAPDERLPSWAVRVTLSPDEFAIGEQEFTRRLRVGDPSVVARVNRGAVLFDLRAVFPEELEGIAGAVANALR